MNFIYLFVEKHYASIVDEKVGIGVLLKNDKCVCVYVGRLATYSFWIWTVYSVYLVLVIRNLLTGISDFHESSWVRRHAYKE